MNLMQLSDYSIAAEQNAQPCCRPGVVGHSHDDRAICLYRFRLAIQRLVVASELEITLPAIREYSEVLSQNRNRIVVAAFIEQALAEAVQGREAEVECGAAIEPGAQRIVIGERRGCAARNDHSIQ